MKKKHSLREKKENKNKTYSQMKNGSQKIAEKYFNKWFSHLENRVVCNSNLLICSFVFGLLRIFTAIKYSARLCQQKKIFEVAWEINVNLVKEDLSRVPKNNRQTTAKGCVTRIRCCLTRIRWAFWEDLPTFRRKV